MAATERQIPNRIPSHSPVLIISNEPWDGPKYSKHRYALALSRMRKVYFLDPPSAWRPGNVFSKGFHARTAEEGITVLSYHNPLPLLSGILSGSNDRIIISRLREYFKTIGAKDVVVWNFDPFRITDPQALGAYLSIYHCADDHAFRMRGDRELALKSDHVFCVAKGLMERYFPLNTSVHHMPHGLSPKDMEPVPIGTLPLPAPPGFGLYIGNINDRHDFALWKKAVHADPTIHWVVVGPMKVTDPAGEELLLTHPPANLHYLGPLPYEELRPFLSACGFGFLHAKNDQLANRLSSQKIVQFLALGKPVFCSWFDEFGNSELLYMTDDHKDMLAMYSRFWSNGESPELPARRIAQAKQWLFSEIFARAPFTFDPA